jgi:hypothetical protein
MVHRMNESEARLVLSKHVNKYRSRSYQYLAAFAQHHPTDIAEVALPNGANCKVEIQINWEKTPYGNVRVIAKISDGSAHRELIETFVMRPDGEVARNQGVKPK